MKIYTKRGDKGKTSLLSGRRLYKDDIRIETYGTVDELNSFVGVLNTSFTHKEQNDLLSEIQRRLFTMGSNLASDPDQEVMTPDLVEEDITMLEESIDKMDKELPALTHFVLPGGNQASSFAHVCRTICRRAERRVISLDQESEVEPIIVKYLNRLSDYFFQLSRYLAHIQGSEEVSWIPRINSK